ncbi:SRPBCC family protein [Dyadobacter crusticola]|uniref:SRPBCC family protein n=1 Tax=Dyadobacter crusticola TaxID=292407 RepID=UPI0004E17B00|nr:SRPBCC domain-containing protein [Dyadobacter crusticola]
MTKSLITKKQIQIDAPVAKVWEVLIAPKYIRQWDDLPQDFGDYYLELGRTIEWTGFSRSSVTTCDPLEKLVLHLYAFKWELPASDYDIAYTYLLTEESGGTRLTLEIGDFGVLEDGESYYVTSEEFAGSALEKIKSLAENRV